METLKTNVKLTSKNKGKSKKRLSKQTKKLSTKKVTKIKIFLPKLEKL